ncbi:MAG: ferrochelatase [Gemmatimonadetes bacterium]|nr:ferrochelatase [Gemmatimonadota bacterium]
MIGVLVMAYGGPDSLDDIEPYLLDVRGGRPTNPSMVEEMRERYRQIGGRSPILERTQAQAQGLQHALDASPSGPAFRCFVGMRHWTPRIETALRDMDRAGVSQAVGLVMAPHYSRMSIGAYFKKVAEAESGADVVPIERWHLLPELTTLLAQRITATLDEFPGGSREEVHILFTAHSLPERILEWNDPYPDELQATVHAVVGRLRDTSVQNDFGFAYQSAAMTPGRWLGPDVRGVVMQLHEEGVAGVLVVPIGFTSDHVEILYDIDVELARHASALGIALRRIPMMNDDQAVMAGLARLVRERATAAARV